jgi:hypothetical protein
MTQATDQEPADMQLTDRSPNNGPLSFRGRHSPFLAGKKSTPGLWSFFLATHFFLSSEFMDWTQ